jgi:lysozyme
MAKKKKKTITVKRKSKGKSNSFPKIFIVSGLIILLVIAAYLFYSKDNKIIKRKQLIESIPPGFPSFGIDVSHHQGEIDWVQLLKKEHYDSIIQFVYCKATEGSNHIDTKWFHNRLVLQKLGIPNGAYHFFSPKTEPRPQAIHFLNQWEKSDFDLPPVLDVESEGFSNDDLIAKMKIWLIEIEEKTGMRSVIYTSLNFFETKFMNHFKDYKFWIAAYSRKPAFIDDSRIIHWQYSESGELPGITEKVDFNVSKISYR